MTQLGEPYDWSTPWEGIECEDIFEELIEKTNKNEENLRKVEAAVTKLQDDFKEFKDETVRIVRRIFEKRSSL
jgi:hypothetical protein